LDANPSIFKTRRDLAVMRFLIDFVGLCLNLEGEQKLFAEVRAHSFRHSELEPNHFLAKGNGDASR
jgi:hypothetical protein